MTTAMVTDDPEPSNATVGGGSRVTASLAAVELGRRLLVAARAGDTQSVLQLMAKGAYFTSDWLGTSPLHLAAMNGHAETCAVLLRAGVSRDARTKVERTPLHLAAYGGHCAAARVLLAAGARVDSRDMLAMTPLHWAAARGHTALAALLLARGADPLARSKFHKTPRSLADASLQATIDEALRRREAAARRPPTPPPQPGDASAEAPAGAEAEGARLLRRYGITMLPTDDGGTVLSALRSGRTVVLSDAGKLMLKESGAPQPAATDAGCKLLTLNNKLLTVAGQRQNASVKYLKLPADAKVIPSKAAPSKAKTKPPVVKILINKSNLSKLMTNAGVGVGAGEDSVLSVPEQFVRSSSVEYLRVQLLATHAALANVSAELRAAKARLARYEPQTPPD